MATAGWRLGGQSPSFASLVCGGDGNDELFDNGPGAAVLMGEAGDDLLVAVGGGADTVRGGAGNDSFWVDSADSIADAEAAETPYNVHVIAQFYQPTADPVSRPSLEIRGQDLTDPSAGVPYVDQSFRPLFLDGPEYNDAIQGGVGDCYFIATLSSLAGSDPAIIKQAITDLGDGTYAVRFYRGGSAVFVRVDGRLCRPVDPRRWRSVVRDALQPLG